MRRLGPAVARRIKRKLSVFSGGWALRAGHWLPSFRSYPTRCSRTVKFRRYSATRGAVILSPKARRVFPLIEVRDQNSLQITNDCSDIKRLCRFPQLFRRHRGYPIP